MLQFAYIRRQIFFLQLFIFSFKQISMASLMLTLTSWWSQWQEWQLLTTIRDEIDVLVLSE